MDAFTAIAFRASKDNVVGLSHASASLIEIVPDDLEKAPIAILFLCSNCDNAAALTLPPLGATVKLSEAI
ncbi:MAG TPA: hypothetical protein VH328_11185, partial [Burkholderiaceae bacterium]|nr:hypothetical protein [Burkholderiaceae bacterium]